VVVLLTVAGLHVPVMPFVDMVGSIGATAPLHIAGIALKEGKIKELTVTVSADVVAHCPTAGVNV
jgi:hypothetical protein